MQEIGYVHLAATIMGKGLIDSRVENCPNYRKEKDRVNSLLLARYDADQIDEKSRTLVANLIKEAIYKWWQDSRYNVQIYQMQEEIMQYSKERFEAVGAKVIKMGSQNMITEDLTISRFHTALPKITEKYGGLISYYEANTDPAILPLPRY